MKSELRRRPWIFALPICLCLMAGVARGVTAEGRVDTAPAAGSPSQAVGSLAQPIPDKTREGSDPTFDRTRNGTTVEAVCPGDVNASGGVDIVDVQLVAGAYGSQVPAYDLNMDDIVDVLDIQLVASYWLAGCQAAPGQDSPSLFAA